MEKTNSNITSVYASFDLSFVSDEYKDAFFAWLDYKIKREQIYKTKNSLEQCYNNLLSLSDNNCEKAMMIVKQSIEKNYTGLFPLKDKMQNSLNMENVFSEHIDEEIIDIWIESLGDALQYLILTDTQGHDEECRDACMTVACVREFLKTEVKKIIKK